jgi:hypothetical protein
MRDEHGGIVPPRRFPLVRNKTLFPGREGSSSQPPMPLFHTANTVNNVFLGWLAAN